MRGRIALLLCFALLFSPALRLMAEDQAAAAAPAPASGTAASASAAPSAGSGQAPAAAADNAAASPVSAAAAASPTAAAPALPDEAADSSVAAPAGNATEAPTALPKDKVVVPGPAKPAEAPSRYKAGNFVLGFMGGALLCGLGGFLLGTNGASGIDWAKARTIPVACALGGGILGGFGSLWLGAYTPEDARPPQVEGGLPPLGLQASLRF